MLFFKKPYNPITTQTFSRWIKNVMSKSSVNTAVFSPDITRHAATSAAHRGGVNIETILKTVSWTQKSKTFDRFYRKDLMDDSGSFVISILGQQS